MSDNTPSTYFDDDPDEANRMAHVADDQPHHHHLGSGHDIGTDRYFAPYTLHQHEGDHAA